jgi:hypothetical protein
VKVGYSSNKHEVFISISEARTKRGALRVARRKLLKAAEELLSTDMEMFEIHSGMATREGGVWYNTMSLKLVGTHPNQMRDLVEVMRKA